MSFVVPCIRRPDFERYATSKSQAQLFLSGSLLTDTLRDLYDLVVNRNVIREERFVLVMIIVCICFALELAGLTFSIILMINKYPSKPIDPRVRVESKAATINTVEGGQPMEMSPYTDENKVDDGNDFTELVGRTPFFLKSINDGLTVISLLLVVLYTIKSSFYPDETRFFKLANGTSPP